MKSIYKLAILPLIAALSASSVSAAQATTELGGQGVISVVTSYDEEGTPTSGYAIFPASTAPASSKASASYSESGMIPMAVEDVGGGTWNYGSVINSNGTKNCYSHYNHPEKVHTATAIIGRVNNRVQKNARIWANADAVGGIAEKCITYWSTL